MIASERGSPLSLFIKRLSIERRSWQHESARGSRTRFLLLIFSLGIVLEFPLTCLLHAGARGVSFSAQAQPLGALIKFSR